MPTPYQLYQLAYLVPARSELVKYAFSAKPIPGSEEHENLIEKQPLRFGIREKELNGPPNLLQDNLY